MGDDCAHNKKEKNQACILCTVVLVSLLILLLVLYFSLFKPADPKVQVPTMQLLSYTPTTTTTNPSSSSSASLSLNLQVSIYNPNRGDFFIQQGSLACLFFQDQQIGLTPIPTATIPSQSFSTSSISLSSSSPINIATFYTGSIAAAASTLPIATSITISGHVTTANLFSHHSDVVSKCQLALSLGPPRAYIQSYTCQSSFSLDD